MDAKPPQRSKPRKSVVPSETRRTDSRIFDAANAPGGVPANDVSRRPLRKGTKRKSKIEFIEKSFELDGYPLSHSKLKSRPNNSKVAPLGDIKTANQNLSLLKKLEELGVSSELYSQLEMIVSKFERRLTTPPIASKFRPHLMNLLAEAAAAALQHGQAAKVSITAGTELSQDFRAAAATEISPLGRYSDNKHRFASAEEFMMTAYGEALGVHGYLDQATLRKIDPQLMDALNLEFRGADRRAELRRLLPTKSERLDQQLEAIMGYVPTGEERRSALTSLTRGHRIGVRKPLSR